MDRIVRADTADLFPLQGPNYHLRPTTMDYVLGTILAGRTDRLLPIPVWEQSGVVYALDGHHRSMGGAVTGTTMRLWCLQGPEDRLAPEDFEWVPPVAVEAQNAMAHKNLARLETLVAPMEASGLTNMRVYADHLGLTDCPAVAEVREALEYNKQFMQ